MLVEEDVFVLMVRTWGESVLRQVDRVRDVGREAARLSRQLDREWDVALAEVSQGVWRQRWAEEHALVWAAHQLDRWARRLAKERDAESLQENASLRDLRNALEHLDEALFADDHIAEAGDNPRENRALRKLPGGQLHLSTGGRLFGSLQLEELEALARRHLGQIDRELHIREQAELAGAIDSYIDDLITDRRELR